jgi:hypothetical protein
MMQKRDGDRKRPCVPSAMLWRVHIGCGLPAAEAADFAIESFSSFRELIAKAVTTQSMTRINY